LEKFKKGGEKVKNKVFLISLAVVLALSLSIVGCTGNGDGVETFDIVLTDHNPPGSPMSDAMVAYGHYIGNNTDDRVDVDIRLGGSLCLDTELFEYAQAGTADAGSYVPEIGDGIHYANVITLPFMGLPGDEYDCIDLFDTLVSEFPEIQAQFTDQGVYFAGTRVMPPAHFHFYNNSTIVDEPGDMSGLSLICLEGLTVAMIQECGATGIQLGFGDLFTAIPGHLGDGFVNHYAILGAFGFINYLTYHVEAGEGGIQRLPIGILWNKDSWDALVAAGFSSALAGAYDAWLDVAIPGTQPDIDFRWA
jgi:TRAP-type C4-dicarboxylate transport system substrate-binding protein